MPTDQHELVSDSAESNGFTQAENLKDLQPGPQPKIDAPTATEALNNQASVTAARQNVEAASPAVPNAQPIAPVETAVKPAEKRGFFSNLLNEFTKIIPKQ